jgi:hypothetical protein
MGEMVLEGVGRLVDGTRRRLRSRPAFPHRPLVKLACDGVSAYECDAAP